MAGQEDRLIAAEIRVIHCTTSSDYLIRGTNKGSIGRLCPGISGKLKRTSGCNTRKEVHIPDNFQDDHKQINRERFIKMKGVKGSPLGCYPFGGVRRSHTLSQRHVGKKENPEKFQIKKLLFYFRPVEPDLADWSDPVVDQPEINHAQDRQGIRSKNITVLLCHDKGYDTAPEEAD